MFGKAEPQYPWNEDEGEAAFEYFTVVSLGVEKFNKDVNSLARRGWELINGGMAGTAHYGYMRRPLKTVPTAASGASTSA